MSEMVYDPSMGLCWALILCLSFSATFIFGKEVGWVCEWGKGGGGHRHE